MKKFAFVTVLLAIVLVSVSAVSAQADVQRGDFSDVVWDQCTNEYVSISGTGQVVSHATQDANGGMHGVFSMHLQNVAGVGQSSGNSYRYVGGANETVNFSFDGAAEETEIVHVRLVTPGGGNDLTFVAAIFHVTFDANGNLRVSFERVEFEECQ